MPPQSRIELDAGLLCSAMTWIERTGLREPVAIRDSQRTPVRAEARDDFPSFDAAVLFGDFARVRAVSKFAC
jgi:hypothetical protein